MVQFYSRTPSGAPSPSPGAIISKESVIPRNDIVHTFSYVAVVVAGDRGARRVGKQAVQV